MIKLTSRRCRSVGLQTLAIAVTIWVSAGALRAQDPRGTIVGRVTDKSGAVVPNLEIRATNQDTSVVATSRTTSAGDYRIGFLLPGKYAVSAEAVGFKKYVRQNIEVRVTETTEVSFSMDLGASAKPSMWSPKARW